MSEEHLSQIVEELDEEPLAHIMLGQRELFHSNFLAWYFKKFPTQSDSVFGNLIEKPPSENNKRAVYREKKNIDLWFEWENRQTLIIENKVFSTPDNKQLKKYTSYLQFFY